MENTAKWTKVLGTAVLAMAAPLVIATGVSANQLTFSVTPVLPDNQIDKTDGFFNLKLDQGASEDLSLIHISEPTRRTPISYAVFCLKKKKKTEPTDLSLIRHVSAARAFGTSQVLSQTQK